MLAKTYKSPIIPAIRFMLHSFECHILPKMVGLFRIEFKYHLQTFLHIIFILPFQILEVLRLTFLGHLFFLFVKVFNQSPENLPFFRRTSFFQSFLILPETFFQNRLQLVIFLFLVLIIDLTDIK